MRELLSSFGGLLTGARNQHRGAVSSLESDMLAATSEIEAKKRVVKMLEAEAAECQSRLQQADSKVAEALVALEAARDAYAEDPSSANAKLVRSARDSLELAEIAKSKPERLAREASTNLENALSGLRDAQRAFEAAKFAHEVAELRVAASPEEFRSKTEPLFARIVAARKQMTEASAAIDDAFSESQAASAKLLEVGEDHQAVDAHHLLWGFALERLKADPEGAGHLFDDAIWGVFSLLSGQMEPRLSRVLDVPVVDRILFARSCRPVNPRANYADLMHAVTNAPDAHARQLVFEERARQERENQEHELQTSEATAFQRQSELEARYLAGDPTVVRKGLGFSNLSADEETIVFREVPSAIKPESSEPSVSESAAP